MAIPHFGKRRDSDLETKPETAKVPMVKHPYNPATNANVKMDLSPGGENVNTHVPPNGREPQGFGESKPIGGQKKTGAYRTDCNEGGRSSAYTRVRGKVIKSTSHPNQKINKIYG